MVSEVEVTKASNMELRMADIAARKDRPFWWNFNPALLFGRQVLAEAARRLHMASSALMPAVSQLHHIPAGC